MMIKTGLPRADAILLVAPAGECHKREPGWIFGPEPPGDLIAIHSGHSKIEKDQIRLIGRYGFEGLHAAKGSLGIMPTQAKEHGQALGGIDIVIDDENPPPGSVRCAGWFLGGC